MKYSLITGLLAISGANCRVLSHIEGNAEAVEVLRRVPEGWRDIGAPAEDHRLHLRIAVRSVSSFHAYTC